VVEAAIPSRHAGRDFAIALVVAIFCWTVVMMVLGKQGPGQVVLVLLTLLTAPMAVTMAWWLALVVPLLVVLAVVVVVAPVPRWLRIPGLVILISGWIMSGAIWLGQHT
jgi:hypothetical protein